MSSETTKKKSRMFPFITKTWNPIAGECSHKCKGCWARALAKRYGFKKYQGQPRIDEKQINHTFKAGEFIFVQDMSDLFAENVPQEVILRVFEQIKQSPDARFLLLTKNPKQYLRVIFDIPKNCLVGATIESNRSEPKLGNAPSRISRAMWMAKIKKDYPQLPLFVSVEPILDFDTEIFAEIIAKDIRPEFVAVGYDNYNNGFSEPNLEKTKNFIRFLKVFHEIIVYEKTLREANV